MKRQMTKLMSLLAVLALLLTGCNMVKVDSAMQLEEDFAALKTAYDVPVAEYDGGAVSLLDVTYQYQTNYVNLFYTYYMYYGTTDIDSSFIEDMKQDVLETRIKARIASEHVADYGVELTEEDLAECRATAQDAYASNYADYLENNAEGDTPEEKILSAQFLLYRDGLDEEAIYRYAVEAKAYEKLTEAIGAEIAEPDDESLAAVLAEKTAAAQETYTANPSTFESDATADDKIIYWYPEGYRTVKHILIVPEEAVLTALTDAMTAQTSAKSDVDALYAEFDALTDDAESTDRTGEQIQNDILTAEAALNDATAVVEERKAACIANVQDKIDEVYARIDAGESFADLVTEYDADTDSGMISGKTAETGYFVSAGSTGMVTEFVDGAMALENVGDVSQPVVSQFGIHIIQYTSDVTSGAPAFADIREQLLADYMDELRTAHCDEVIAAWVEAANVKYHYENWVY